MGCSGYLSVEDMTFDFIDGEYLSVMFPALRASSTFD